MRATAEASGASGCTRKSAVLPNAPSCVRRRAHPIAMRMSVLCRPSGDLELNLELVLAAAVDALQIGGLDRDGLLVPRQPHGVTPLLGVQTLADADRTVQLGLGLEAAQLHASADGN